MWHEVGSCGDKIEIESNVMELVLLVTVRVMNRRQVTHTPIVKGLLSVAQVVCLEVCPDGVSRLKKKIKRRRKSGT